MFGINNQYRELSNSSKYGLALGLFLLALSLRFTLFSPTAGLAYVTFYPAVIVSFYVCGLWPGVLTAFLSALAALYFFGIPHGAFPDTISGYTGTMFFALTSTLIGITTKQLQDTQMLLRNQLNNKSTQLSKVSHDLVLAKQASGAGVWRWDLLSNKFEWDDQMIQLFGMGTSPPNMENWLASVHPDDVESTSALLQKALDEKVSFICSYRIILPDNQIRWIDAYGSPFFDDAGKITHMAGICIDSTKLNESLNQIRDNEQRFRYMFENLPVAYQSLDRDCCWLDANQKMAELLGFDNPAEMIGQHFKDFWSDDDCEYFSKNFSEIERANLHKQELHLRNRRGEDIYAIMVCHIERDSQNHFVRAHSIVTNITEHRQMEEKLSELNAELEAKVSERTVELEKAVEALTNLSRTDALTALPNRLAANERIHTEFLSMRRRNHPYGLLMLDIDHFKRVNDTFGHAIGDSVLNTMADAIKNLIRADDFACRFGGEEFLILLPDSNIKAAHHVAEKIRLTIESLVHPIAGNITVSIGVTVSDVSDPNEYVAIKRADDALYVAKNAGRNQVKSIPEFDDNEPVRVPPKLSVVNKNS